MVYIYISIKNQILTKHQHLKQSDVDIHNTNEELLV